jgi:hypothetical protein
MLWPLITAMSRMFGAAAILSDAISGPGAVLALTAVAVTGLTLLVVLATRAPRHDGGSSPVRIQALPACRRDCHTAYVRLRDPDAAGRPKPRAPSLVAAAA